MSNEWFFFVVIPTAVIGSLPFFIVLFQRPHQSSESLIALSDSFWDIFIPKLVGVVTYPVRLTIDVITYPVRIMIFVYRFWRAKRIMEAEAERLKAQVDAVFEEADEDL